MVLAVIPVLIDSLTAGELNTRTLLVVAAVAGLRFIDKFLHNIGKSIEEKGEDSKLTLGITRF